MAKKKKKEDINYKEMSIDELGHELDKSQTGLFKLRFRSPTAPIKNVMEIRTLKRDVARIKTFINQKRKQMT